MPPSEPSSAAPLGRLAAGDAVVLDVGEETIDCRVVSIAGDEVALATAAAADAAYIPSLGRAAALLLRSAGGRGRVAGAVRPGTAAGRLAFRAGAGSDLPPRRRAARAGVELSVQLTPLDEAGEPAGPPVDLTTSDAGLGGLGVPLGDDVLAEGTLLGVRLELPAGPPLEATARVLRVADGVAGLELVHVTPTDRARLAALLLAGRAR